MSMGAIPVEDAAFYGITQSRAARLWEEEGRRCHWCQVSTVLTKHSIPNQATEDHVVPRGSGGTNNEANVVSACLNCNARRNKEHALGLQDGALMKQPVRTNYVRVSPAELQVEYLQKSLNVARGEFQRIKQDNDSLRLFLSSAPIWLILWKRWHRKARDRESSFWATTGGSK